jgi:hypothetical protein
VGLRKVVMQVDVLSQVRHVLLLSQVIRVRLLSQGRRKGAFCNAPLTNSKIDADLPTVVVEETDMAPAVM